jgi:pyridoxine 5-phosphate synthase
MTKLSVNLNKFALLRNSRGGEMPDVLAMARRCIARGAHGITVHPRPDQRHTRDQDVRDLAALVKAHPGAEFNVEGNPTAHFIELVLEARPDQCTLVPDAPDQLTSDHGWDLKRDASTVAGIVRVLREQGIRVSVFLDPVLEQVSAIEAAMADRIELYTASYAGAFGTASQADTLKQFALVAERAQILGVGVNAGHDLNLQNLAPFLEAVPSVLEVSIGHALVCESFDYGLEATIDRYLGIVSR